MSGVARILASLLVAAALLLGGARPEPARALAGMAMAGMTCTMAMSDAMPGAVPSDEAAKAAPATGAPCKPTTAPCCKHMAACDLSVPARSLSCQPILRAGDVAWVSAPSGMPGLDREPEHMPPRTA